jgi:glucose-6-phosphate 1-epimerase
LGLPTHSRHEYRIRKVWKDGRKDELGEPFFGLTRYVSEEERNGVVCEGEYGRMYVRYDGATVTSWKPEVLKGGEVFFMPTNTPWGSEVHGGIPICWPWFGKREGLPKHGLARYLKLRLVNRIGKDGVVLEAASTPETMKIWPHSFKLTAKISVAGPNSLKMALTETNTGKEPFESAWGFHPYFRVTDAERVAVDGETLPPPSVRVQSSAAEKGHRKTLADLVNGRTITVECADNEDWFVWNPGVERTPLCETLGPDEWRHFYCIEPFTEKPKQLAPGESRIHEMTISVR